MSLSGRAVRRYTARIVYLAYWLRKQAVEMRRGLVELEPRRGWLRPRPRGRPASHRPSPRLSAYPRDRERQEFDMSDTLDWNAKTIAEFRANEGRVGGNF